MGKFIFITGGARSGKSTFAVDVARIIKQHKVFMATCIPEDDEMKERVRLHKKSRPSSWRTVECGVELKAALKKETKSNVVILIDCLTLFIAGLLMKNVSCDRIKAELRSVLKVIKQGKATVIIVSNEVGSGLVPETKLGRDFRDIVGVCNRISAASADEVNYVVAGIPLKIKGK